MYQTYQTYFTKYCKKQCLIEWKKWPEACNFIKKETLVQLFSCEFCEISKNTFYHRTPLVAASVLNIYLYVLNCNL